MTNARAKEAQLALMLLTRLPAGRLDDPPKTGDAAWAFPFVGALVGLIAGVVCGIADWLGLPPLASALLALLAAAWVTGGLHEDGLADTADGFGGGADKSRKLEIMRDSRIGSYGVIALIFVIGLTASAIPGNSTVTNFVMIGILSRTAMLLPMAFLPPARTDGLGHAATLAVGPSLAAALCLTLGAAILTWTFMPLVTALIVTAILMGIATAQIGGQTGDTLGATQKLTECVGWLTVAASA